MEEEERRQKEESQHASKSAKERVKAMRAENLKVSDFERNAVLENEQEEEEEPAPLQADIPDDLKKLKVKKDPRRLLVLLAVSFLMNQVDTANTSNSMVLDTFFGPCLEESMLLLRQELQNITM